MTTSWATSTTRICSTTRTWRTRTSRRTTTRTSERAAEVVALGLGGNLPTSRRALRWAVGDLGELLDAARAAPLFLTAPHGDADQPPYLNSALVGWTRLEPEQLLGIAKALEWAAGRRRAGRDAPRILDVDLLLAGRRQRSLPGLTLPHPRLRRRRFVLEPLARIAPRLPVPPDGATVAELLAEVGQAGEVTELPTPWPLADAPPLT